MAHFCATNGEREETDSEASPLSLSQIPASMASLADSLCSAMAAVSPCSFSLNSILAEHNQSMESVAEAYNESSNSSVEEELEPSVTVLASRKLPLLFASVFVADRRKRRPTITTRDTSHQQTEEESTISPTHRPTEGSPSCIKLLINGFMESLIEELSSLLTSFPVSHLPSLLESSSSADSADIVKGRRNSSIAGVEDLLVFALKILIHAIQATTTG